MSADSNQYLNKPDTLWQNIYWIHNGVDSRDFQGQVLYLGMGNCFLPRYQSSAVTNTVIVEYAPAVIEHNHKMHNLDKNWSTVVADAWQYTPDQKFDIIVVDIWYDPQCASVVDQLVNRYRPWLTVTGKIVNLKTVVRSGC